MPDQELCHAYIQRLKKHECPDATFAFFDPPLVMDSALGSQIRTVSGDVLTDLCAGFGVLALGHNHPRILECLSKKTVNGWPSVIHGMGDVYPSRAKVQFFEAIVSQLPESFSMGALALSGSQAVEIAVKTAILYSGRSGFLVIEGGYHGLDLGTLSLATQVRFQDPFKDYLKLGHGILPREASTAEIQSAIDHLEKKGVGFAGVIIEPIQGRAGVKPLDPEWLRQLIAISRARGGLIILDEIFCGLGRAGRMSFTEIFDADLTCLGKALGGGLPLSACMGKEKVMRAWPESQGEAIHTGTFFGHPLACELAMATFAAMRDQDLCTRARLLGDQALIFLRTKLASMGISVTGQGLMIGLDYRKPQRGVEVMNRLRRSGVLALVSGSQGECLSITPALNIPENLFWSALEKIVDVSFQ